MKLTRKRNNVTEAVRKKMTGTYAKQKLVGKTNKNKTNTFFFGADSIV